jgi:hypothetical protein
MKDFMGHDLLPGDVILCSGGYEMYAARLVSLPTPGGDLLTVNPLNLPNEEWAIPPRKVVFYSRDFADAPIGQVAALLNIG